MAFRNRPRAFAAGLYDQAVRSNPNVVPADQLDALRYTTFSLSRSWQSRWFPARRETASRAGWVTS